jgi:hypothetical protein
MRRVLFLDIDGVLNDRQFLLDAAPGPSIPIGRDVDASLMIDPLRVRRLNTILDGWDVNVVLSSAWRVAYSIVDVTAFLRARGYAGPDLFGETPLKLSSARCSEIRLWLYDHDDVDRFVIVDDLVEAGHGMGTHFVRTTDGLEDEHVELARGVLA